MRLPPAAGRAVEAVVGGSSGPVFDGQSAPDRTQGPLELSDVGTMVGVQELANRSFADVEAPGQLHVGNGLTASRSRTTIEIPGELLAHVSPLCREHINLTGEYRWKLADEPDGRALYSAG